MNLPSFSRHCFMYVLYDTRLSGQQLFDGMKFRNDALLGTGMHSESHGFYVFPISQGNKESLAAREIYIPRAIVTTVGSALSFLLKSDFAAFFTCPVIVFMPLAHNKVFKNARKIFSTSTPATSEFQHCRGNLLIFLHVQDVEACE